MKIVCLDDDNYIVYIPNVYYKYDDKTIYNYIDIILKRIKNIYSIELYSIFNIECYIDNTYGIILEINIEYDTFNIYAKRYDINLKKLNTNILFEIEDYISEDLIIKNNKFYIKPNKCNNIEFVKSIIYKEGKI